MIEQGRCDTTKTMRYDVACGCADPEYPDNLGPCATYLQGGSGKCVYCEHPESCHQLVTPS